jgi:hypothetical protein
MQQKLENASTEEKQTVFDEIVPDNTLQLIQDLFGNYVSISTFVFASTQQCATRLFKNCSSMEPRCRKLSLRMLWKGTYFLSRCKCMVVESFRRHVVHLKCFFQKRD